MLTSDLAINATAGWGSDTETNELTWVALARPPDTLAEITNPRGSLLREKPDVGLLRAQTSALTDYYRGQGVRVSLLDAPRAPPNIIFLRDTFAMSRYGAILARPAYLQRQPEIPYVRDFLEQEGVPILGEVAPPGTFEGADALWLDPKLLVIGVGKRTNVLGARQVARIMADIGVATVAVTTPALSQHLLGAMNFISATSVATRTCLGRRARALLSEQGKLSLEFRDDSDVVDRRCLNFVTIASGIIVAPLMSEGARAKLERRAARVDCVDIGEYLKCDGGIACATGIIARTIAPSTDLDS